MNNQIARNELLICLAKIEKVHPNFAGELEKFRIKFGRADVDSARIYEAIDMIKNFPMLSDGVEF